jgi:predicted Zn-dependent protease
MQRALMHYQQIGRLDEAVKIALNLAMALPFESYPQYVSGRLLLAIDQPERALVYLRRAARMAPADVDTWLALSEAYDATGQQQEARNALEQLLRLDPGHSEALRRLE